MKRPAHALAALTAWITPAALAHPHDLPAEVARRTGCSPHRGTTVFVGLALDSERTLESVLRSASADGSGYGIERVSVPLRLLAGSASALDSRAQARRVAARLNQFARAELDFDGVAEIGHSFADELFRVLPQQEPRLALTAVNACAPMARMIEMVRAA